jgi:nucleotide-binding universal stress UspA family protein
MASFETQPQLHTKSFAAPDRILVATDLTDIEYLIPHAVAQCEVTGASLILLHVIPPAKSGSLEATVALIAETAEREAQMRLQEVRRILSEVAATVRSNGINCDIVIRHGHPREVVKEITTHLHADRILLGTHSRRNLKKFFLGSNSLEILKVARVPVWTVGPLSRLAVHGQPTRILHPVSLSGSYRDAAELAVQLGQFYKAEVTLLHVLPRVAHANESAERLTFRATAELSQLIPDEMPLWTTATIRVEAGEVVERILSTAEDQRSDLIVLGSNPDIAFWPVSGDNTVYNVIAEAKCPVVTLRQSPRR